MILVNFKNYLMKNYFFIFGVFILFFLSLLHMGDRIALPYIGDEFGYWSNAAYMAGYDWSNLTSQIGYYSFGYSILLIPLFLVFNICNNMFIVYKVALFLNILWWISAYFFLYKSIGILNKNSSKFYKTFIALTSSLYVSNIVQINFSWPEVFLFTLFCLLFYVLLLYIDKQQFRYITLSLTISLFMYTVHQRAISVVVSVLILIFIDSILKERKLKTIILFIIFVILSFLIFNFIKDIFIEKNWNSSKQVMSNVYSGQISKLKFIFSVNGFIQFILSFASKLYYLLVSTLGLITIPIVMSIKHLLNNMSKHKLKNNYVEIFLVLTFIISVLISTIYMINPSGNSHIVYGRYNEYILGPFLMLAFLNLKNVKENLLCLYTILGTIPLILVCSHAVSYFKNIVKTSGQAEINNIAISKWVTDTEINTISPTKITILFIFIFALIILLYKSYKKIFFIFLLLCCCIWIYIGDFSFHKFMENSFYNQRTAKVVNVANYLNNKNDKENINIFMLINDNIFAKLGIQFMMPNANILEIKNNTNNMSTSETYLIVPNSTESIKWNNCIYSDNAYKIYLIRKR